VKSSRKSGRPAQCPERSAKFRTVNGFPEWPQIVFSEKTGVPLTTLTAILARSSGVNSKTVTQSATHSSIMRKMTASGMDVADSVEGFDVMGLVCYAA
jgi:hypothetical protein